MEKRSSIKAVAAAFLGISLVGMLLSVRVTSATDLDSTPVGIVQGP